MANLCATCLQNTNNKAKPGIFPCIGCKQIFCMQHAPFHRQELANELDLVIGERNQLQELLDHQHGTPDISHHIDIIDEWVKKTIEQVHQAADNARQRLIDIAQQQRIIIKDEFTELSKQLNDMRENENFFEQDIASMKDKCIRLKAAVNQVNTNINTVDVYRSLDGAITFKQTTSEATEVIEVLSYVENILKHQKPCKQIKVPHDGTLSVVDGFALIKNHIDYSIIDLADNSMRSISLKDFDEQVHCWSSCHNAYFSKKPFCSNSIQFIPMPDTSRTCTMTINNEGSMVNIACFAQNLLTVSNHQTNRTMIEEWRLNDANQRQKEPSLELVSRWREPLSCAANESIKKIAFNAEHIVLAINNSKNSPKNRLEFRTRGMLILGHIVLDENVDFISIPLLSMKDGWLLGQKKKRNESRHYTLIDSNLHEHKQEFLSTQNIENIAVVNASYRQVLAIYRKRNDVQTSTDVNQKLVLDLYEMQQRKVINFVRKKL